MKRIIDNNEIGKAILNNNLSNKEELEILFKEFDIDFFENIDFFIDATYSNLETLSPEPYDKYNSFKIKGLLKNICFIFDLEKPKDLIDFVAKIFLDILTQHKLINGNKRVVTMLLYKLCYYYGLFIKNSLEKEIELHWKTNEKAIVHFVEEFKKTHDAKKIQNEIYNWIKQNLYILNNFF